LVERASKSNNPLDGFAGEARAAKKHRSRPQGKDRGNHEKGRKDGTSNRCKNQIEGKKNPGEPRSIALGKTACALTRPKSKKGPPPSRKQLHAASEPDDERREVSWELGRPIRGRSEAFKKSREKKQQKGLKKRKGRIKKGPTNTRTPGPHAPLNRTSLPVGDLSGSEGNAKPPGVLPTAGTPTNNEAVLRLGLREEGGVKRGFKRPPPPRWGGAKKKTGTDKNLFTETQVVDTVREK